MNILEPFNDTIKGIFKDPNIQFTSFAQFIKEKKTLKVNEIEGFIKFNDIKIELSGNDYSIRIQHSIYSQTVGDKFIYKVNGIEKDIFEVKKELDILESLLNTELSSKLKELRELLFFDNSTCKDIHMIINIMPKTKSSLYLNGINSVFEFDVGNTISDFDIYFTLTGGKRSLNSNFNGRNYSAMFIDDTSLIKDAIIPLISESFNIDSNKLGSLDKYASLNDLIGYVKDTLKVREIIDY